MSWKPPDNFYPGYSLYKDIGYGPEGEKNLIGRQLEINGFKSIDQHIQYILELTRDLMVFISDNCDIEVQNYSKLIREEQFIAGSLPTSLLLAKLIIAALLELLSSKMIDLFKELIKKIKERIEKKRREGEKVIEEEIIYRVIKKLNENEVIVEKLEFSRKILKIDKDLVI
jgi:hypothetical protein